MLILDELNFHAEKILDKDVEPLLSAVFELGDELDVESDKAGAFDIDNNQLRIHRMLRRLTLDRFDLASRSKIFIEASRKAALSWLLDFSQSAYGDYHPREGENAEPEEKCLRLKQMPNLFDKRHSHVFVPRANPTNSSDRDVWRICYLCGVISLMMKEQK